MSNVHPYLSLPEPAADDAIRFAYWVPNVSGGQADRPSTSPTMLDRRRLRQLTGVGSDQVQPA